MRAFLCVVVLSGLFLFSCSLEESAEQFTCVTALDCSTGWDCIDGICVEPQKECIYGDDSTCPTGYVCAWDGTCVKKEVENSDLDNRQTPDPDIVDIDNTQTPDPDVVDIDNTQTPDLDTVDEDVETQDFASDNDEIEDESIDETVDETADETVDETIDETVDETVDEVPDNDTIPPAGIIKEYLFEFSTSGWTHDAVDGYAGMSDWPYDPWDWTMPFEGPSTCHTDSVCWVTEMKNYINCQRAALYSPAIDLSLYSGGGRAISFSFWQWYSFWSDGGNKDGGVVQVSTNGSTWTTLVCDDTNSGAFDINGYESFTFSCNSSDSWEIEGQVGYAGSSTSWTNPSCVVPASECAATTRFRFLFSSGIQKSTTSTDPDDYNYPGWAIDDITVEAK